jgi:hypothetical protein
MMDALFDADASKVLHRYTADDVVYVVVCTVLRERKGFRWADVDLQGEVCKRQVVDTFSSDGKMDICDRCAWSETGKMLLSRRSVFRSRLIYVVLTDGMMRSSMCMVRCVLDDWRFVGWSLLDLRS